MIDYDKLGSRLSDEEIKELIEANKGYLPKSERRISQLEADKFEIFYENGGEYL